MKDLLSLVVAVIGGLFALVWVLGGVLSIYAGAAAFWIGAFDLLVAYPVPVIGGCWVAYLIFSESSK